MDNSSINSLHKEGKIQEYTSEYLLNNVFYKTSKNTYSPIMKLITEIKNIRELFSSLYPRKEMKLKEIKILIENFISLFNEYPPLIPLLHEHLEKGYMYKQLILLEMDFIENKTQFSNQELLNEINSAINKLILFSVKYYDCPRQFYDLVYQKIASLTLWKTKGFDDTTFQPEMFKSFLELLKALYDFKIAQPKSQFMIPKNYIVMNGNSKIHFEYETEMKISLSHKVLFSWFYYPNFKYSKEDSALFEIKLDTNQQKKNDTQTIGLFINHETRSLYFKNGDKKYSFKEGTLKHSKWYVVKFAFSGKYILLFNSNDQETNVLDIKNKIESDINLNDITLYNNFYGISTSSFILKLMNPNNKEVFGDFNVCLKTEEESRLFKKFKKYGLYNPKIKNFFVKLILNGNYILDMLICPYQQFILDNKVYIEHNQIKASFQKIKNIEINSFNVVNHNYNINRITLLGGVNVFLPLFEIIISSKNKYLETEEFVLTLLELVTDVLGKKKYNLLNAIHSSFFNCLGLFLERVNDNIINQKTLDLFLQIHYSFKNLFSLKLDTIKNLIKEFNQFYQNILLNFRLFPKYNINLLSTLCKNVYDILDNLTSINKDDDYSVLKKNIICHSFNLTTIISYFRTIDKKKFTTYCCLDHKNLLKNPNENIPICEPSIKQQIKQFEKIVILLIKEECTNNSEESSNESIEVLFKMLLLDISPCLQEFILLVLRKIVKEELKDNETFINILQKIELINILVFLLSTSFHPIRLQVIEFFNENQNLLLSIRDPSRKKDLFESEQFLAIALCSKPNTYKRKEIQKQIDEKQLETENVLEFNKEYKENQKIFNHEKESNKIYKFEEPFLFFNLHPEIKDNYEFKFYSSILSLLIKNKLNKDPAFCFDCLLLHLTGYSHKIIMEEFSKLFDQKTDNQNVAKYIFQNNEMQAQNLIFILLEILFSTHKNEKLILKENQFKNIFRDLYKQMRDEHLKVSFYLQFLTWFVYHLLVLKSMKNEYVEERDRKLLKLFTFFEKNILSPFFTENKISDTMKSNQIEHVAHFVSIYYDYLFTFDKIIEFVYTDEEMCHLQLKVYSTIPKDKIVEMPTNSKINHFKFDIPKYILQKDQTKMNSIKNVFFPFCKSLFPFQIDDFTNTIKLEEQIKGIFGKINSKHKEEEKLKEYFYLLFSPPNVNEDEPISNIMNNISSLDPLQEKKKIQNYQFMELGRVTTIMVFYYLTHEENAELRIETCEFARDFILFMYYYAYRYLSYINITEANYRKFETMLELMNNSIFVLFKLIIQELYPSDKCCIHNEQNIKKLKYYIASLLYFNELIQHKVKSKEQKYIFKIFSKLKEEKTPIQLYILKNKKHISLQNIIDVIINTTDIISDNVWNVLLDPLTNLNEKGEINYFAKEKVVHNARKLLFTIQNFIPIFPIETSKINKHKYQGIKLNYDSSPISHSSYEKLFQFQSTIVNLIQNTNQTLKDTNKQEKANIRTNIHLYRSTKKRLFSWRNAWSNYDLFYNKTSLLKQKIVNHYNKDLAQFMITPILDIDLYLPEFRSFKKENLFLEHFKIVNLDIQQHFLILKGNSENKTKSNVNNYLFDLYENFLTIKSKKSQTNTTPPSLNLCLIKKTRHLKCRLYFKKENEIFIEFIHPKKIYDKRKEYILYDKENDTCWGSFFKKYPKDKYLTYLKFSENDIVFILEKKYFYKGAIEFFTKNNKSHLFHGNDKTLEQLREYIIKNFTKLCPITFKTGGTHETIGYFSEDIQKKYFPDKNEKKSFSFIDILNIWKANKISTFHFLIIANLFGGRSFNDLTQYPVFPWTIANYNSDNFDKGKDLRNFSYPMGKIEFEQTRRFKQFQKEFELMEQENKESQETPNSIENNKNDSTYWETIDNEPFYYGTHYSNALYVSHYLLRIFPYSQLRIELQGDNFDLSRLFSSIEQTFLSATSQKTDVRELIPEFFIFPEMFINLNNLNLGEGQLDVVLPKWANSSPSEFVKKLRISLESDECQRDINNWFDLIFGYKQQGEQAKLANNLFMNHTYWGKIQIKQDKRSDFTKDEEQWVDLYLRSAETGLTPRQLMLEKSLPKNIKKQQAKSPSILNQQSLKVEPLLLRYENVIFAQQENSILYIITSSMILNTNLNDFKTTKMHKIKLEFLTKYNNRYPPTNAFKGSFFKPPLFYININYWDNCLRLFTFSDKTPTQKMIYCEEDNSLITSIIIKPEKSFAIFGTQKGSLIICNVNEINEVKVEGSFFKTEKHIKKQKWTKKKIINDHYSSITTLAMKDELNILISGDQEGYINIYTYPCFKLIRSLKVEGAITHIFISDSPLPCFVVFVQNEFKAFTINGTPININDNDKQLESKDQSRIVDYVYYRDSNWNEYLILGTTTRNIEIRAFPEMKKHNLIHLNKIEQEGDNIKNMFLYNENKIIVLTEKGYVYS